MRTFSCICGQTLFFENVACENCFREVGWCPSCCAIAALESLGDGTYRCANTGCDATVVKCTNYAFEHVCNRCLPAPPANGGLCDACRFNRTIPDLSVPGNRERWAELEAAKRRLLYTLDFLGLPYGSADEGFDPPLAFDFKADTIPSEGVWRWMGAGERVYTGHADGKITINIREADSVEREKLRVDMGEAHRTLNGHFRHEIGHYFWDLLVRGHCEDDFKRVFGDHQNPPYGEALQRHYSKGPPLDWRDRFVSAYATMHPWEDWAETFALYLDITSVLDTASKMGMIGVVDFGDLHGMVGQYRRLGLVLNELNREMGLIDVVPEVLHAAVVEKLDFVHGLVRRQAKGRAAA
jgi:hypothetical protein